MKRLRRILCLIRGHRWQLVWGPYQTEYYRCARCGQKEHYYF
jgi:hypothetical protein